jgi:hypothetical protein
MPFGCADFVSFSDKKPGKLRFNLPKAAIYRRDCLFLRMQIVLWPGGV